MWAPSLRPHRRRGDEVGHVRAGAARGRHRSANLGAKGLTSGPVLRPCRSPSRVHGTAAAVRARLSGERRRQTRARTGSKTTTTATRRRRRRRSKSKRLERSAELSTSVRAYGAWLRLTGRRWREQEKMAPGKKSRSRRRASQDRAGRNLRVRTARSRRDARVDRNPCMHAHKHWQKASN